MRVLVAGGRLWTSGYGGTQSVYTLCEWLNKRHSVIFYGDVDEHSCKVISTHIKWRTFPNLPFTPPHTQKLLTELMVSLHLRKVWTAYTPDLYICDWAGIFAPGSCKLRNAPSILFLRCRDWGDTLELDFELNRRYPLHKRLIQQITFRLRGLRNRRLAHHFSLIIANSRFIQNSLSRLGLSSEVVYPFIELDAHLVPDKSPQDSQFITFVNCSLPKGLAVAYEVARCLPEYRFLFVGIQTKKEWRQKVSSLPNVTVWEWQEDMRKVWRVTKILLVPSLRREPFGRVPVEAGINAIPSIASRIGGLPESVGDGGILIDEPRNVEMWCEAVEKLMENDDLRNHLGEQAKRHAERLRAEAMLERFRNIVWKRLGIQV